MSELTHQSAPDDLRGDARLIDKIAAVQLVLASRDLNVRVERLLNMVDWLLGDEELEPAATMPTRLFVAAIKAERHG